MSQEIGSNKRFVFSGLEWRSGWDSNPARSFRFCKLQILKCRLTQQCQQCRRALHHIAPPTAQSLSFLSVR